jgi:PAS domain S-box-containing protein
LLISLQEDLIRLIELPIMDDNIKILLLEDNPSDVLIILEQIRRDGIPFTHHHVKTKKEYLAAFHTFKPDLVISDYFIPQLNGMQALTIRNEVAPDVSFILITGSVEEDAAVSCMKSGADDYLMKRNLSRLGEAIKSALQKKMLVKQKEIAEKRLEENEMKYRLMVDLSPDAIVIHSVNGLLFANATALKLLGADSFDKIRNMPSISFVHPDYREIALRRIKRSYKTGEPSEYAEEKYVNLKGKTIDVEVISFAINYMGKPAIQSILRDISYRKIAEAELIKSREKAEESARLKSAFLQNISHEIRTPVNAIMGFAALLNESDLDYESRNYVETITQSSRQLLKTVTDIIEISNIEAGIYKPEKSEVGLNALMDSIYNKFVTKTTGEKVRFTLKKMLPDQDSYIITDEFKLEQILTNLLNNAFKFTSYGQIDFGYTPKDKYLLFYVSDTGIGIPENQHSMIFNHFYQVEPLAFSLSEGSGLGLSISKAYIGLLGGKIWLRSEPGEGAVFYFTIPYEPVEKTESVENRQSDIRKASGPKLKTLLIAEDDNNNYYLMQKILSGQDIRVLRASNGIEAVDICRSGEKIDMILMDIRMPLMDGYEATKQIHQESPDIKIIIQTAYSDNKEKAIESGCSGFISKPFDKQHLVSLVREFL